MAITNSKAKSEPIDEEAVAVIIDIILNKAWTLRQDGILILAELKKLGYQRRMPQNLSKKGGEPIEYLVV